ncbi:MAG: tRNA lysidine(34) synthetase TilS [Bacteroidia bacterium]|nr:tRNA lysidine(34) synthetase TilS [Bacteroidia bacterium]
MPNKNQPSLDKQFSTYLEANQLINKHQNLLLACSGGADSVALGLLLFKNNYRFSLAYMNFNLRKEAEEEEIFVQKLAEQWKTFAHIKQVSCQEYANQHKISIQEAARILRYHWFNELINQFHYDYLLTAHHLDDQIETIFASVLRSSEFAVIFGIPEKRTLIVRPLLNFCKKKDLQQFLESENYTWCEDVSNSSNKYQRNFIRNHLIKDALLVNPGLHSSLQQKIGLYTQQIAFIEEVFRPKIALYETAEPDGFVTLNFQKLAQNETSQAAKLFEIWWLSRLRFSFKQIAEILALRQTQVGKKILLNQYEIWRERSGISIGYPAYAALDTEIPLQNHCTIQLANRKIYVETLATEKYFLRYWKAGDRLKISVKAPNSILISDFLTNKSIPARQKKNCFVITTESGEIIALDSLWYSKKHLIKIQVEWMPVSYPTTDSSSALLE